MLLIRLRTAVGSTYLAEHLALSRDLGQLQYGAEPQFELLGDQGFDGLESDSWQAVIHEILPVLGGQ